MRTLPVFAVVVVFILIVVVAAAATLVVVDLTERDKHLHQPIPFIFLQYPCYVKVDFCCCTASVGTSMTHQACLHISWCLKASQRALHAPFLVFMVLVQIC